MSMDDYFTAFAAKDLAAIKEMFAPNVSLQDPFVGLVEGFDAVVKVYEQMFRENDFELIMRRRFGDDKAGVYEFSLAVTNLNNQQTTHLDGVDFIEARGGKITSIRAYLDTSVNDSFI